MSTPVYFSGSRGCGVVAEVGSEFGEVGVVQYLRGC